MRVMIVTLKMYRIDTGKYIDRFTLLVMANRKIFIYLCLSLRVLQLTCRYVFLF